MFRNFVSEYFMYSDSAELFNLRLARIATVTNNYIITGVSASYAGKNSRACLVEGNVITIEFTQQFGDLPMLVVDNSMLEDELGVTGPPGVADVELYASEFLKGTKEEEYCSNRGICDYLTGVCACSVDYDTSDGDAGMGNSLANRGDCGVATADVTACPGEIPCSGHGVCTGSPKFRCMCSDGWMGAECSEMKCPFGAAWFDFPVAEGRAHSLQECAGRGTCDRSKGDCFCEEGVNGGACDRIQCPGLNGEPCSGHGTCLSMKHLAQAATFNGDATDYTYGETPNNRRTWDREALLGCQCDPDYEGFNCELRSCPKGDDPRTYSQPDETQTINCTLTDGGFRITFRQETTEFIPYSATRAVLKKELEALGTIGKVDVVYTRVDACALEVSCRHNRSHAWEADQLCMPYNPYIYDHYGAGQRALGKSDENIVKVTFLSEHGDLPPMTAKIDTRVTLKVGHDTDPAIVKIETDGEDLNRFSVRGTKERLECSGRGTCDYTTGICRCFDGYASSDGRGRHGELRDCGHVLKVFNVGVEE
jgi:hypothetical protein